MLDFIKLVVLLVFEPSQAQGITSGLKTNFSLSPNDFIKRIWKNAVEWIGEVQLHHNGRIPLTRRNVQNYILVCPKLQEKSVDSCTGFQRRGPSFLHLQQATPWRASRNGLTACSSFPIIVSASLTLTDQHDVALGPRYAHSMCPSRKSAPNIDCVTLTFERERERGREGERGREREREGGRESGGGVDGWLGVANKAKTAHKYTVEWWISIQRHETLPMNM